MEFNPNDLSPDSVDLRWQCAVESSKLGIWDWNATTGEVYYSPIWKSMLGYEDHEIGNTYDDWKVRVHPDDLQLCVRELEKHFSGQTPIYGCEHRLKCKDGAYKWVLTRGTLISKDKDNKPIRVIGTHTDIHAEKLARMKAAEVQRLFKTAFSKAPIGMALVSMEGKWLDVNETLCKILGYTESELLTKTFQDVTHPEDLHQDLQHVDQLLSGVKRSYTMYKRYFHKNGSVVHINLYVSLMNDENGNKYFLSQVQDITDQINQRNELIQKATTDNLTKLNNRAQFENLLRELLDNPRAQQYSLMFLDLDYFKVINDSCGHQSGDLILQHFASIISTIPNSVVGRIGGDEFAILLDSVNSPENVAEKIISEVAKYHFHYEGKTYRIGCSIGFVYISRFAENLTPSHVLGQADAACYIAKQHGRNQYHEYTSDNPEIHRNVHNTAWLTTIQEAISSNNFRLYAQPIIGPDPDVSHHEVLLRLQLQDRTLVYPSSFLPPARRYGALKMIDRWVFDNVVSILSNCDKHICLHINLSPSSISDIQFQYHIIDTLEKEKIRPSSLKFEIVETEFIDHESSLIQKLRDRGFKVYLDDFGTGFMSLDKIKMLNVDGIKIDKSYTQKLTSDPINQTIVQCICTLGSQLGMDIVAEGVETEDVAQMLHSMGVREMQGHLYSKAVPIHFLVG